MPRGKKSSPRTVRVFGRGLSLCRDGRTVHRRASSGSRRMWLCDRSRSRQSPPYSRDQQHVRCADRRHRRGARIHDLHQDRDGCFASASREGDARSEPCGVAVGADLQFTNAERAPFVTGKAPGLDINGDGRGCNTLVGRFAIKTLTWTSAGTVAEMDVLFEQHCEGMGPALRGELWITTKLGVHRTPPTASSSVAL